MHRRALLLCLAVPAVMCAQVPRNRALLPNEQWVKLFNGKDLTGWVPVGHEKWTVEDGTIHGQGVTKEYGYLRTEKQYKDFWLSIRFKCEDDGNSGVYFHTEYQDMGFPKKGFEVQVNNSHSDPIKSGSLYHVKDIGIDVTGPIVKDDQWFTERIVVKGNHVTIFLNDKQVVDWTQPADWNGGREGPGRVIGHGTMALQGHDPNSTVYYKNIQVKLAK